jgi:hypothetical protein
MTPDQRFEARWVHEARLKKMKQDEEAFAIL